MTSLSAGAGLSSPAQAAAGDPLTLTDPSHSGISVSVTPSDLSTVRQGDDVHLHFSGLGVGEFVYFVGTCPAGLPQKQMDPTPFVGQFACQSRLPTGLPGDTDPASGNTPGLSTSIFSGYPRPDGTVDVDYLVGAGNSVGNQGYTVILKNGDRQVHPSLTCDKDTACTIGFEVQHADGASEWRDLTSLAFSPLEAGADTTGCKGLSQTATIAAAGPERLQDPISALDRGYCQKTPSPIPVSFVPATAGEADPGGVKAVGTTADLAFAGSPVLARNKLTSSQIAVPIALNAVSIAQIGGATQQSRTAGHLAYNGTDLQGLALTPADTADIVLHNFPTLLPSSLGTTLAQGKAYNPLAGRIISRPGNSGALQGLDPSLIGVPYPVAPTVTYGLGADSTAVALSSYLTDAAGSAWAYPTNAVNTDLKRAGKAVGRISGFSTLVDHSQVAGTTILTSQTSSIGNFYSVKISKDITTGAYANTCPLLESVSSPPWQVALTKGCVRFAVMDTTSAAALSLPSAHLGDGTDFVAPTAATLQSAAAGSLNADGYFAATGSGSYPLTYVEYAVVPKAPLLDSRCAQRAQQGILVDFLKYVTGDGQTRLAPGLSPLTAAMRTSAQAAIAAIGKGPATGACAPKSSSSSTTSSSSAHSSNTTDGTNTTSSGTTSGTTSGLGSTATTTSGGTGAGAGAGTGAGNPSAVSGTAVASLGRTSPAAQVDGGVFGGAASMSSTSVVLGLVLLTFLVSGAAVLASRGIGPRALVAMVSSRFGGVRR